MFGIVYAAQHCKTGSEISMKYCHNISVNVFVKPEDVVGNPQITEQINDTLKRMLPVDWNKEANLITKTMAEGFEGRKIIIYELRMVKEKHTNLFIKELNGKLTTEQKRTLISEKNLRLDENDDFYLRLDKNNLIHSIYELTTSGDCFHIRMNIAAFPKKRENAIKIIDEIFEVK